MWYSLAKGIIKYRLQALLLLLLVTIFFGYKGTKIELSYEFNSAIPKSSDTYIIFENFKKQFGGSAEVVVIGLQTKNFFQQTTFNKISQLQTQLKQIKGVVNVVSAIDAVQLLKDSSQTKFIATPVFAKSYANQQSLDSSVSIFSNLPFYRNVVYNPETNAYIIAVTVNKQMANSKQRTQLMQNILQPINEFKTTSKIEPLVTGLPYIRTVVADKLKAEMNYFLIGSLALSALVLLLFFRSFSAMVLSLGVVAMGVVWCFGLMVLLGYKITLLTALIPPLIVVIGVPNCIYFLNKYHSSYTQHPQKQTALYNMVGKMGVVTLFCNIAAAIGFAVFSITSSSLLKEFGIVSGIIIMALFVISLLLIPAVLSYLPAPTATQMAYLNSAPLQMLLHKIHYWVFAKTKWVVASTLAVLIVSIVGLFQLKKEGFIVDDINKKDKLYTDLKWVEYNFKGIMPLEITIDTKKKKGLQRSLAPIEKIEEFSNYIQSNSNTSKPMSFVEGLKWVRQSFYDGDTNSYTIPTGMAELALMSDFLKADSTPKKENKMAQLINNFLDSNRQIARLSVNMKDIGTKQLPILLDSFKAKSNSLFDTSKYTVQYTGSSVAFLEGSKFIIDGLKESIIYAFILIAICMLYLFKNIKIVLCSLIPNIIPLVITAGIMGYMGIRIKPSTVLVFSVALGIVIDITIRFLVNYKQELGNYNYNVSSTLSNTIYHTGISIIYTSIVLIAGFIIFCFSGFAGTQALGWLTGLTLFTGTITNLIFLPILMKLFLKK